MSADSATFCRDLATRIAGVTLDHPVRLGIDGVDAAGKTTLADAIGAELIGLGRPIVRASIDGFHRPRAERYRLGRHSPEGYYRDSFQNDAVIASLLGPLGPVGSRRIRRAVFDYRTDRPVVAPEEIVPPDAILVFDGIFSTVPGSGHIGTRRSTSTSRSRRPWRVRHFATAGRRPWTIRPISGTWQANASISRNVTRLILHPLWSTTRISPRHGSSRCGLR